jgi:beta-glucanase (GH16 family)
VWCYVLGEWITFRDCAVHADRDKYHNNTQEIDMEFLSKQFNETDSSILNLVIQSPESQAAGFNAIYTPGFADPRLLFRSDMAFHDYRFDWTPGQVAFYADDRLLRVMTENIPDSGGHMVFNHWSNGDEGWSAGPPTQDT